VIDPAQTLALIEATHEFVDHYGVGKWNHDPRANEIDWPKFRADAEALLNKRGKSYKIKDGLRKAAPDAAPVSQVPPKIVCATTKEKIRIIKQDGYRTQIPLPENPDKFVDRLYACGEVVEQDHWKACDLIKRGIAEAVTA